MLMEEADQIRSLKGDQMKDAVELTRVLCNSLGSWWREVGWDLGKMLQLLGTQEPGFIFIRENKPVEEKQMCNQNLDLILTFIFLHSISRK